jgi:hypothetical protein
MKKMGDFGEEPLHLIPHPETMIALETHRQIEGLITADFGSVTLKDLVLRSREKGSAVVANV